MLTDLTEACGHIREVVTDLSFEEYDADWKLRAIIERQLITIGEAVSALIKLDPSFQGRITHARRIVDLRNILVHAYAVIDNQTIWGVIMTDVPRLASEVQGLLAVPHQHPTGHDRPRPTPPTE
jgi:uncharacterized protein with HEPN domain